MAVTEMASSELGGLMPIGQVVSELGRTSPDVTHSSLRFLEREGFVRPVRTAGGHRLYSRRDVDRIRQIKAWQAQRLSLAEIRSRLAAIDRFESAEELSRRFFELVIAGEQAAAANGIRQADDLGMPLEQIFGEVLQPALYAIGDCWASGDVVVGQEKETSAMTSELVAELTYRHAVTDPTGPLVITACVDNERHCLGLQMIAGLLRVNGWRVHPLGIDVEPRFLVEVVQLRNPAAVLLSASLEARLPAIRSTINLLTSAGHSNHRLWVVVGGQAVPNHVETIRSWGATPIVNEPITQVLETLLGGVERAAGS
jgi:methanogenic corrinoid protein MtbC1